MGLHNLSYFITCCLKPSWVSHQLEFSQEGKGGGGFLRGCYRDLDVNNCKKKKKKKVGM